MIRTNVMALVILGFLAADARAIIKIYLDQIDDARTVNAVSSAEKVNPTRQQLQSLHDRLMKLKKPDLIALLGQPADKAAKSYALPVAELRGIALPGLRSADDHRPDSDFVSFHPVGDFAGVEVYYSRHKEGDTPLAVIIYLKVDPAFPKLAADNLDQRLAWETERLKKLTVRVAKSDPLGLGPKAFRAVAVGDWSEAGDNLRGRLLIVQGHPRGEGRIRETAVYVELQNVSDAAGGPINVYFDNRLTCELRDAADKVVPPVPQAGSGGRPAPTWVPLPYDSSIRLRANPYGFGRPKSDGFLIPFAGNSWLIAAGDTGEYYLSGTLTVTPPDGHRGERAWHGTLTFPKMLIVQ
jgi:hypothetical protein